MTDAPAAMPGEEDVARAICASDFDYDETVYDTLSSAQRLNFAINARAVLALFAPILAEKERQLTSFRQYVAMHRDRALAAEAAVLAVAPYVDSIVCYASTVDEHDGNCVAKLVNEAAAAIRAQIAAPGAAMEE